MEDRRTRMLLGQAMVILIGPLCLLASLLLINLSGEGVSEGTMVLSYLAFMLGVSVMVGGVFLWVRNRQ